MPTTPPQTPSDPTRLTLDVDVRLEHPGWGPIALDDISQSAARATLLSLGLEGEVEISLLGTGDAEVARLNADFRGKPTPTNVLSWPSEELMPMAPGQPPPPPSPGPDGGLALGDIALSFETCAREADASGKPLKDHATHLVVHAILHLLGYDHMSEDDARLMEGLETEILATLGIPDPYLLGGQAPGEEAEPISGDRTRKQE